MQSEIKVYQRKEKASTSSSKHGNNLIMEKEDYSMFPNTPLKPIIPKRTYIRRKWSNKNLIEKAFEEGLLLPTNFAEKDNSFGSLGLLPDLNESLCGSEEFPDFGSNENGEFKEQEPLERTENSVLSTTEEAKEWLNLPIVMCSTSGLSANATCQDNEQSQEKVTSFEGNEEKNSKKRKENGVDLKERLLKKPKKKIHRPKVVGEGKPKRTPNPKAPKRINPKKVVGEGKPKCTPKPKAPKCMDPENSLKPGTPEPLTRKRVISQRNTLGKRKNKNNLEESVHLTKEVTVEITDPIASCRRSLNFDMENHFEDESTSLVVGNGPLEAESSTQVVEASMSLGECVMNQTSRQENSIQVYNKKLQINCSSNGMSLGHCVMNQKGCQENSIQVHQKKLQKNQSSKCLEMCFGVWELLEFRNKCRRKRTVIRRRTNKEINPPLVDELKLLVKKGKRSKRSRKNFDILKENPVSNHLQIAYSQGALAYTRQESESFQRLETKNDALSTGEKRLNELEPSNLDCYKSKSEGSLLEEQNLRLEYKLRGYSEGLITDKPTVTDPFACISEFQSDIITEGMMNGYFAMEPNFFSMNFQDGGSERSLREHEDFLISPQSKGPCEGSNTLLNQERIAQNFAQYGNGNGMVVPDQGFLGEDQNADVPHYEHGAIVVYGGLPEKDENKNSLVPHTEDGALVPHQRELSLVKKTRKQILLALHAKEIESWKLQLFGISKLTQETEERWENERRVFHGRIDAFTARMHVILGNRRFSPWKGSVVDSVVGVFLTQNVSDILSSSAFMSLAAKFRAQSGNHYDQTVVYSQESCGSNTETTEAVNHFVDQNVVYSQESSESNTETIEAVNHLVDQNVVCSEESIGSNTETAETVTNLVGPQLLPHEATEIMSSIENAELKAQETMLDGPHSSLSNSFLVSDNNLEVKAETNKKIADDKHGSPVGETVQEKVDMQPTDDATNSMPQKRKKEKRTNSKKQQPGKKKIEAQRKKNVEEDENGVDWDEMRRKYCRSKEGKKKENQTNWDELKRKCHGDRQRHPDHKDSMNWEAVRRAKPSEVADSIKERGQHRILALRIQEFLDRVVELHGNLDLEWLRYAPPEKVKKYLLEFHGLGLKSVECIRLLGLRHVAFPVDTNVGRIAVRLGWVPLEPLPEELQIHLLQLFPVMDSIQKYLWPRLCTLDQESLYELHYQLITFGKVFCTKRSPNCNECPMRGDCRHFASKYASARRTLPKPEEKGEVSPTASLVAVNSTGPSVNPVLQSLLEDKVFSGSEYQRNNFEPIIEEPASPEPEREELELRDIEDELDDIPMIRLSSGKNITDLELCFDMKNMTLEDRDVSRALVALPPEVATYPVPKLKQASRLRTKHLVYELPDSHPLLIGLDRRDSDERSPYLLAILTPGETANSNQPSVCSSPPEENTGTIPGTILIPCRTANNGSFPLNGTYFQVNEVFADHESSEHPIDVPRSWIWNLPRRIVYFGTSATTIFRGLTEEEIQQCFWQGFVCTRGFDRKTGGPKPLGPRFHISTSQVGKKKNEDE